MIAGAVEQRPPGVVGQVAHEEQIVLERLEGLEGAGQDAELAFIVRIPAAHIDAVRDVHERHTERRLAGGRSREGGNHGIEERERHGGPHSSQKRASRKRFAGDHFCTLSPRLDWNGRLRTTSKTKDWNGYSPAA